MNQRRQGRQLILAGIGIVVLVLLLGLFFLSRGSGGGSKGAQAGVPSTADVVVATQAIPQGTTFRAGQPLDTFFSVRQAPRNMVPFGAYSSVRQIEHMIMGTGCQPARTPGCQGQITTTQTIYQNLPVVSGMFSTLGQYRVAAGPAFSIPYGYVGIAINMSSVNSVLGSIQPGDTVDLMASYGQQQTGSKLNISAPAQTQYIMNDLRVIGVGGPPPMSNTTTGSSSSSSSSSSAAQDGGSLLILARYQEALEIQHLKDFGWQLSVVLRSAKESSIPHFRTLPVTDRWFFVKSSNPFKSNPGY